MLAISTQIIEIYTYVYIFGCYYNCLWNGLLKLAYICVMSDLCTKTDFWRWISNANENEKTQLKNTDFFWLMEINYIFIGVGCFLFCLVFFLFFFSAMWIFRRGWAQFFVVFCMNRFWVEWKFQKWTLRFYFWSNWNFENFLSLFFSSSFLSKLPAACLVQILFSTTISLHNWSLSSLRLFVRS